MKKMLRVAGLAGIEVPAGESWDIMFAPEKPGRLLLRAGDNSTVNLYHIQKNPGDISIVSRLGEGAVVRSHYLWLLQGHASVQNHLEGANSEAHDLHLFLQGKNRDFRLETILIHSAKDTKGDILVKGIVREKASAKLEGMIKVGYGGAGAESLLSEHVILLNPGAHAFANPQLEIENNDVSSTHSASVSQIDEKKLFYLESRGIDKKDAKRLIVEGFVSSAIDRIEDKKIREAFSSLIFAGLKS